MKLMIQRWHLRGLFQVSQVLDNLGGYILIGVIVKMCEISWWDYCENVLNILLELL